MTQDLKIDLQPWDWPITEQWAYREVAGVNPMYAIHELSLAAESDDPEGAMTRIDPSYLLAFVWIAERRERADLTFDKLASEVSYGDLIAAMNATIAAEDEALQADDPLGETNSHEETSSPTSSESSSSKSSAGRGPKSSSTAKRS